MTNKKSIREVALDILESIEKKGSYSNLLLKHAIDKYHVSKKDANLLTEIIYGTLQRKLTIDYYLQPFLKKSKKIEPWVMNLLRLSVYQFAYLTKIPDHAIIHEAVEIGKKRGHKGIASFINGVLRSIQRKGLPSIQFHDPIDQLAIETSHPKWLVQKWVDQFGMEQTARMCYENNIPPKQTARINRWKISPQDVLHHLKQEGIDVELSEHLPNAVQISQGNLASTDAFQKGWISIQDKSSMFVGFAIDPKEGERILDMCSAPGGKATDMAERMNNTGTIVACDLHSHKLKLIEENKSRLGLSNMKTVKCDARKASSIFPLESFDRILVDAPCSGLGVIRRKPEIKYTKSEGDIQKLVKIQKAILQEAAKLVKKGGLLVYSTCTVIKEENEEVAEHFLKTHPEFERDTTLADRLPESVQPFVRGNRLQLFPHDLQSDGFFIASFQKKV